MVRHADGPTASERIEIAADPRTVWRLVSDPTTPSRFSTELVEASWVELGDEEPGVGARIRGRNRHEAIGEWETTSTIVAWEPERVLAWSVEPVDASGATWRLEITPTDTGCALTQSVRMGPGPSGLTPALEKYPDQEEAIIARRLEEHRGNMRRTLEGIRDLAEQR